MQDDPPQELSNDVVNKLLSSARTKEQTAGSGRSASQLTKRLVEPLSEVELTDHVAYDRHQARPRGAGNTPYGTTTKTLTTDPGQVGPETSRDRDGSLNRGSSESVSGARGVDDKTAAALEGPLPGCAACPYHEPRHQTSRPHRR